MGRPSNREKLLEAGVAVLHERGFNASGVREITQAAGVPLGSFTNHFRSKEEFAGLVLDRYMAALLEIVRDALQDEARRPLQRIEAYFSAIEGIAEPLEWRFGCMLANMSLELPSQSEELRDRLVAALDSLTDPFVAVLTDAQRAGQVRTDVPPGDLAVIVLAAWHGVLIRAKVERDGAVPTMFARTLPLLLRSEAPAGD